MQAIRSLKINAKAGNKITVPSDEIWKVWYQSAQANTDFNLERVDYLGILGGGIRIDTSVNGGGNVTITGIAFKL